MPIRHAIWKVVTKPELLAEVSLGKEALNEAVSEVGFFGNQNTVARPKTHKWNHTIEQLKQRFGIN